MESFRRPQIENQQDGLRLRLACFFACDLNRRGECGEGRPEPRGRGSARRWWSCWRSADSARCSTVRPRKGGDGMWGKMALAGARLHNVVLACQWGGRELWDSEYGKEWGTKGRGGKNLHEWQGLADHHHENTEPDHLRRMPHSAVCSTITLCHDTSMR